MERKDRKFNHRQRKFSLALWKHNYLKFKMAVVKVHFETICIFDILQFTVQNFGWFACINIRLFICRTWGMVKKR